MDHRRRLGGKRKSSSGQAPILAALLFILLVPTTIILAENATINITGLLTNVSPENTSLNISGLLPGNLTNSSDQNATIPPLNISIPDMPLPGENATPNSTSPADSNTTSNATTPGGLNATINATQHTNETNTSVPELNATINITQPLNETNATLPGNQTSQDPLNETPENATQEPPENQTHIPPETTEPVPGIGPVLEVRLLVPDSANRNEPFNVSAEILNIGDEDALDVELEWVLPEGLDVVEGSGIHTCEIPSGAACTSQLLVAAPLSSNLGDKEIKILVSYVD